MINKLYFLVCQLSVGYFAIYLFIDRIYADWNIFLSIYDIDKKALRYALKENIGRTSITKVVTLYIIFLSAPLICKHRKKMFSFPAIVFSFFLISMLVNSILFSEHKIFDLGIYSRHVAYFFSLPLIIYSIRNSYLAVVHTIYAIISMTCIYFYVFRSEHLFLSLNVAGHRLSFGGFGATAIAQMYLYPIFLIFLLNSLDSYKSNKNALLRCLELLCFVNCLAIVIASFSRGAILALAVYYTLLLMMDLSKKNLLKLGLYLNLIMVFIICKSEYLESFLFRFGNQDLLSGRGSNWINNLDALFSDFSVLLWGGYDYLDAPHNIIIGMLVRYGATTLFFWFFFFIVSLYFMKKQICEYKLYPNKILLKKCVAIVISIFIYANYENFLFVSQNYLSSLFFGLIGLFMIEKHSLPIDMNIIGRGRIRNSGV